MESHIAQPFTNGGAGIAAVETAAILLSAKVSLIARLNESC